MLCMDNTKVSTTAPTKVMSGFAYFLTDTVRLLDEETAMTALQQATKTKSSFINYLAKHHILNESQVAKATSEYYGLPLCNINAFRTELIPSEHLNMSLVKKYQALAIYKKKNILYVAITDPTLENLAEIKFFTGLETRFLVVEVSKFRQVIDKVLNVELMSKINSIDQDSTAPTITTTTTEEEVLDTNVYAAIESRPVIDYINKIIMKAVEKRASDIHFECYKDICQIRFRIDGLLVLEDSPPVKLASFFIARIKVMSNLDITEHRLPQDGRFTLNIGKDRSVDFRVSTCPMLFGEKIVLRILNPAQTVQSLTNLQMEPDQYEHLLSAVTRSQGLIIVTGPTGSGKTVTLYSALHFLNSIEKNISTAEDPVEIPLLGINQVHVNPQVGLTFAIALRAFLRQDPDVIMVGEIRDLETADIATKASQTGHLVLSTLHTNSAPETITRLINMGVAPYNLSSALKLVIAQRLVRTLCPRCKVKKTFPEDVLINEGFAPEEISTLELYEPGSCDHCHNGIVGRMAFFEVLPISQRMEYLIMRGGKPLKLMKQAKKEGIIDLREAGLRKVKAGLVSLSELNRVFR